MNKISYFKLFSLICVLSIGAFSTTAEAFFWRNKSKSASSASESNRTRSSSGYGYQTEPEEAIEEEEYSEGRHHQALIQKVALLLPLTGKHAEAAIAIKEGFLASYYDDAHHKPIIGVYDTTKIPDVQKTYELAVDEGADLIIGPLTKEEVERLSQLGRFGFKVPVLALNHSPAIHSSTRDFIQFSLRPEAEAMQIANKAWQKGYHNAVIIVPDNPWGKRIATALTNRWHKFGGNILQTVYANPHADQAAAVRKLLGVDESLLKDKQAAQDKSNLKPRRRQDIEVILMAAPPDQARQLKPLFDFYYAEDVPVFATSSIYNGTSSAKRDRDLNGIIFCDMPWLINETRGQKMRHLLANRDTTNDQFNRLFAMGVDAYTLTKHLPILKNEKSQLPGVTGDLRLKTNNTIHRQLECAQIKDGIPRPLVN